MRADVTRWANEIGISVLWPEDYVGGLPDIFDGKIPVSLAPEKGFRGNPCIDYGKFIRKIPTFVLQPRDIGQLQQSLKYLNENNVPFKVRGTGHSSGGQVLIKNGVVVDLRLLSRVIEDRPEKEEIRVQGGTWWLDLMQHLHPQNRRPLVLTDNVRTSCAGTLAVGGFGDTSHLHGLQISTVSQMTLVTLDGKKWSLKPDDSLFRYSLGGRGQLGVIAEVTIRTMKRPALLAARLLKWGSVSDFLPDALTVIRNRSYEYFRSRLRYAPRTPEQNPVVAVAGNFSDELPTGDPALDGIHPERATAWEKLDLYKMAIPDPLGKWRLCSPAIEMVFPIPDGLQIWTEINKRIVRSRIHEYMPRGSSVLILKTDKNFPVAPFPGSEYCMIVSVRPAMDLAAVGRHLPLLQELGIQALKAGAKIYLMSIELNLPEFTILQFGSALPEFLALKSKYDPKRLLNPGLL